MLPKKPIKEDRSDREINYTLSEKETCKAFLKEYNKKNKVDYRFASLGNPIKGEPSCICTDDLNIEIAPVYYNKDEAEAAWGFVKLMKKRAKNKDNNRKNKDKKDCLAEATQMFCDSLNERIKNKTEKKYNNAGKLFLIIEDGVGLTEKEAVEYYINQGKKFTNAIFDEIWLMLQFAGHYKIYLLDKK
ncbi:MAG: hypothetical protein WBC45_07875 [Atribacterota bacterium]